MTTPIPIELEPEVDDWLAGLSSVDFRQAAAAIERLELHGHMLRMPYSRSLGGALFELRFLCEGVQRRITYWFVRKERWSC